MSRCDVSFHSIIYILSSIYAKNSGCSKYFDISLTNVYQPWFDNQLISADIFRVFPLRSKDCTNGQINALVDLAHQFFKVWFVVLLYIHILETFMVSWAERQRFAEPR